jgi:putative ABC transport system permease protein
MHMIGRAVSVGWRRLRAAPAFTFFSVLTLALGIAAVTTAWVMVRALAAPPRGVPDVHELVTISHGAYGSEAMVTFSRPDFEDLRRRQTTMGDVAAFRTVSQVLAVGGQSYTSLGELVSGGYFEMLRVNAALGRVLQPADDQPGAALVTVLSHDVWERAFDSRTDVIGRTVMLWGHPFEVVGVAPRDFVGLFANGRFPVLSWVPLAAAEVFEPVVFEFRRENRDERWLHLRGRPRQGVDVRQIAAEVAAIGRDLDGTDPIGASITDPRYRTSYKISRAWVARHTDDLLMDERASFTGPPLIITLMSAVGLVLLVTCTNLANLVMARAAVRREELTIRLALGATRWQLMVGSAGEVIIITVAGTTLALGISWFLVQVLGAPTEVGRGVVFALQPVFGIGAVGVSLVATLVVLLVAGVAPAAVLTSRGAPATLMSGTPPTVVARWRVRRALIAGQVAVSILLLSADALFVGRVAAQARVDFGVDIAPLAVVEVDLALQNYDDQRMARLVDRAIERLRGYPGITSAAASAGLPFGLGVASGSARVGELAVATKVIPVTPGFFGTTGIAVVHGTELASDTQKDDRARAVINAGLAHRLFGRTDVVGQQLDVTVPPGNGEAGQPVRRTIVGVVEEARDGYAGRVDVVYLPLTTRPPQPLVFTARTSGDTERVAEEIRSALIAAEPQLGVSRSGSARTVLAPSTTFEALAATVASVLGGIGFTVVLAGLYGVLSYLVSRRTREIGMRLALGATPAQVQRLVIGEGLAPVLVGLMLGGGAALLVRQILLTPLFPVASAHGVALVVCVPLLILAATATACYFPARRASRIDPATALKQ